MSQKDIDKQSQQLKINLRTPPPFPPPSCPRCSSSNTKFCYYNNYSELQPRYFCKNCRRYWTHGGVVRTLPSTRKRGRTVFSSLNSQISKPPPSAPFVPPSLPAACKIGGTRSSVGCLTLGAPITDTTQSFGGGGLFSQTPFKISQVGDLGNVNPAFGVVNARGFGVRAPLLPTAPLTPLLTNLSPLDDFRDFGFPLLQQPQFQPPPPPPQPPTVWTSQNMACNSTSPNNFLPITRDLTAAANVVNINEWPEFNDMDTYKTASP